MSILSNKYVRDLVNFPRDARLAWERRGWQGVRRELAARTTRRVFERTVVVALEADLDDVVDGPVPDGLRIARLGDDDWPHVARITSPATVDRLKRAHARGRALLLGWRGERVVAWTILSFEMAPDLEKYPMPLPPETAYAWDLTVMSVERGKGTGAAMVRARAQLARELGAKRLRNLIERDNHAALRIARSCFRTLREFGELRTVRFLSFRRYAFHPLRPGG